MMRLSTLFSLCMMLSLALSAQSRLVGPASQSFDVPEDISWSVRDDIPEARFVQDTLFPSIFGDACAANVFNFTITDSWGFISGTNEFLDIQKAQRLSYTANTPFMITETWAYFGAVSEVGNGNLRMKIYDIGSGGAPGTALATSSDLQVSDIQLDDMLALPTIFTYSNPPSLTETDFFASVDLGDLYASNDTVGVFMTDDNCGDGNNVWEEWSDNTWHFYSDPDNWGINAELFMAAVLEFTPTDVNDPFVETGDLRLYPAQPNPAVNQVELGFTIAEASQVTLDVFSAEGRLISSQALGRLAAGSYQESFLVSNLAAGTYVYAIRTETDRLMSRFVVGK